MSRSGKFLSIAWPLLLLALPPLAASNEDEYIDEAQKSCLKNRDTLSCVKYRTLKYVTGVAEGYSWEPEQDAGNRSSRFLNHAEEDRTFKLINIKNPEKLDFDDVSFLGESRQLDGDTELEKVIKFGKRKLQTFLMGHGISVMLPRGARAVEEGEENAIVETGRTDAKGGHSRGKKKKLSILFPLLSLLATLKVKVLLIPILLTVLFIKKILVLAALFLPTLLSSLKICKVNMPHGHHTQYASSEGASDYGGAYGASYAGYAQSGNTGYGKEWAAGRAYNGHKMAMERQNSRISQHPEIDTYSAHQV